jgi:hypothetical protein
MHGNQLDFHVSGGRVHVTALRQWENRGDQALELVCDLVDNWPDLLEGRKASVFYGDSPPAAEYVARDLIFCSTIRTGDPKSWLPFPCPYALRWPQIGVPDAEGMLEKMLADEREWESPKIFWIGTEQHSSRRALADIAATHPELLDVTLMEWARSNPAALVSKSRQVSLPDHRLFKYLVDCPGRGYSARLKWLLATGRPVFIVDRDVIEPWHAELQAWVHFVPVAADLSDLLDHLARLEAEPGLYQEISRNAREFAARQLRVNAQLIQVAEKLRESLAASRTHVSV